MLPRWLVRHGGFCFATGLQSSVNIVTRCHTMSHISHTFHHLRQQRQQVSSYIDGWGPPPQGELETPLGIGDFAWILDYLRFRFRWFRSMESMTKLWNIVDSNVLDIFGFCPILDLYDLSTCALPSLICQGRTLGKVPGHSHWPSLRFHSFWAALPGSCKIGLVDPKRVGFGKCCLAERLF